MITRNLKKLLYRLPGNRAFYSAVKKIGKPPKALRPWMGFYGAFEVETGDGKRFKLYHNGFHLENEIFWKGWDMPWERKSRDLWAKLCPQTRVIFDIGANTGIFSVMAKAYAPNAKVYSFEPQPNIYKVLAKNNEINHFDIVCENLALSDTDGVLPFYNYGANAFEGNTTAGSLNQGYRPSGQQSIDVRVMQLAHYVQEKRIAQIDLIKMDVETFEPEVLRGYGPLLAQHRPIILIEIQNATIGEKVASFVNPLGYGFYYIDEEKGLIKTNTLNVGKDNNYLLCPSEKLSIVEKLS